MGLPKPSRVTKLSGANERGQGNIIHFPCSADRVQNRGNLTQLIHTLAVCVIIQHTRYKNPWQDQCEWHIMTRITGPDCAVVCNLINTRITITYTHTNTHTHSVEGERDRLFRKSYVRAFILHSGGGLESDGEGGIGLG